MSETPRRTGKTPLRGRPLDDDGAIQFERPMSETPNDDLNYPVEAVRLAYANGFRDGQASCAPWMQHKLKCARTFCLHCDGLSCHPDHAPDCPSIIDKHEFEPKPCTCGLDKHRAALRTRAGGER